MPRFVLLSHDHPAPHLDLMFEADGVLLAWRVAEMPGDGESVAATKNADHRLLYLDHEGPVSGGRGSVRRIDSGEFDWIERGPDRLAADVRGEQIVGRLELVRVSGDAWRLAYRGRAGHP